MLDADDRPDVLQYELLTMYSSHEHDTVEVAGAQYDTVTALGSTTNLMMPTESKSAVHIAVV